MWQLNPVVPGAVTEPGLVIYRFGAALFYANAGRFAEEIRDIVRTCSVASALAGGGCRSHHQVDYTAARVVRRLQRDLAARGVTLVFAQVQST